MKAKLIKESMYQRMSVEEFVNWYENLVKQNPTLPWYNIVDTLVNDEDSTDGELYSYLMDELHIQDKDHIIEELLDKREYFMDFRYSQEIDAH